jgi:hypothetical protein
MPVKYILWYIQESSVTDPDPYVFGPPGSFLLSKKVRKTLNPTLLWLLYDFLSLKNDENVVSKSNKLKKLWKQHFLVAILKVTDKIAGSVQKMSLIRNTARKDGCGFY